MVIAIPKFRTYFTGRCLFWIPFAIRLASSSFRSPSNSWIVAPEINYIVSYISSTCSV